MSILMQQKRAILSEWETVNPIVELGELVVIVDDLGKALSIKIGDGVSTFVSLPTFAKGDPVYSKIKSDALHTTLQGLISTLDANTYSNTETDTLFYKKTDVDSLVNNLAALVYTKNEMNSALSLKSDVATTYNKLQSDANLNAAIGTVYLKGEVDTKISNSIATVYSKAESDVLLGTKTTPISNKDLEITDSSKGIVLTSPNGQRHRITVNDANQLVSTIIYQ